MAKFDISQFSRGNPGVTAAMSMKRDKHKKKSPSGKPNPFMEAAARRNKETANEKETKTDYSTDSPAVRAKEYGGKPAAATRRLAKLNKGK
jgi:hypothetical protein